MFGKKKKEKVEEDKREVIDVAEDEEPLSEEDLNNEESSEEEMEQEEPTEDKEVPEKTEETSEELTEEKVKSVLVNYELRLQQLEAALLRIRGAI